LRLTHRFVLSLLLVFLVGACSPPESGPAATPDPTPTALAEATPEPRDSVRFAAVGDIGEGNDVQHRVGQRIAALHAQRPIDVLLLLGDIIYPDGAGHRYQARFAEPWAPVLEAGIPMLASLGNHDVQTASGRDVMELFDMPARYYSATVGPSTFLALDTNRMESEQLQWLRSELAEDGSPWQIPFMHAPPYSSGWHGSTGYVQRALDPIAREFEVPLVIAAHDHNYERTHPIAGTVYLVVGTGCCLRPVGESEFTAISFSEPGVLIGEADEERLSLEFVHADGHVLDAAEVDRSEMRRSHQESHITPR
jgi:3',5'-cyclic AMP phosphodiesterase CpdA